MDTVAVNVRLPRELVDAVDGVRRSQPGIPTRPEAIRIILADWLAAHGHLPPTDEGSN